MFIAFLGITVMGCFFFCCMFWHCEHDMMFETQYLVTVLKLMQCPDFSGLWFRNERKEKPAGRQLLDYEKV